MELVKMGKDKYLIKGTSIIISEKERAEQGIIIDGKGCENCSKKEKPKKKENKKKVEKIVEEIIEEQPSESEVDADEVIKETIETL